MLSKPMRCSLICLVAWMAACPAAKAAPLRCVFSGTVSTFSPTSIATGVSPGDYVSYTIVLDFASPARINNEAVTLDAGNPDADAFVSLFFADLVTGSVLGPGQGTCEQFASESPSGDPIEEYRLGYAFANPGIAEGIGEGTGEPLGSIGFLIVGYGHDTVTITGVDPSTGEVSWDGTEAGLVVGETRVSGVEILCGFGGVGLDQSIFSELTLTRMTPIASVASPGGVGAVAGRITNGGAVTCATVVAFNGDTVVGTGSADLNGDYVIRDLPFGSYQLKLFAPGYQTQAVNADLNILQKIVDFDSLTPDTASGTIAGTISEIDPTGAPLSETPLAGARVDALVGGILTATTFSCALGAFQLSGLSAKQLVTLDVSAQGFEFAKLTDVAVGTLDVGVGLPKGLVPGAISGGVIDSASQPVAGAAVEVKGLTTAIGLVRLTNSSGLFSFVNVPDGDYAIHFSAPDLISTTIFETLSPSSNQKTVRATLSPGNTPPQTENTGTGEEVLSGGDDNGPVGCAAYAAAPTNPLPGAGWRQGPGWRNGAGDVLLLLAASVLVLGTGLRARVRKGRA